MFERMWSKPLEPLLNLNCLGKNLEFKNVEICNFVTHFETP